MSQAPPRAFLFDYAASAKLAALYERYGSFPVVADRWAGWDAAGMAPCAGENKDGPSAEDLAEEYHRITSGVMQLRMRRLRAAIPARALDHGEGHPAPRKRARNASSAGAGDDAPQHHHHPLLSLLAGHPLLRATQRPGEDAPPPHAAVKDGTDGHENEAGEVGKDPVVAEEPRDQSWVQHHRHLFQQLTTPGAWYDAARERHRRRALIRLLEHEARINVPYNRAGASYLELVPRATQVLFRLLAILPDALPVGSTSSANGGVLQPHPGTFATVDSSPSRHLPNVGDGNPLAMVRRLIDKLSRSGKPILSMERPCNEAATEGAVKVNSAKIADDLISRLLKPLPSIDPMAWRSAQESLAKISNTSSASAAASFSSTVLEVLEEAFEALPIQCTRLLLCSQAGWLLPPSASLQKFMNPTTSDDQEDGGAKNGNPNTPNNINTNDEEKPITGAMSPKNPSDASHGPGEGREVTSAEMNFLQRVHRYGTCNQAHSNLSETVLLTLPPAIPRLHREVEQELEKYLWEDPAALMVDTPPVQQLTADIRVVYSQNIILQRLLTRLENLDDTLTRLHGDAQGSLREVHGTWSGAETNKGG
ncbi:unnamed protein product [Phytomonas sp. EM1]|nr:unnamed protein product [Phytomonas sp. EM1]|eukprot:CCW64250.1 unnamed protein product [Phytomonas sp. isolate EM1]